MYLFYQIDIISIIEFRYVTRILGSLYTNRENFRNLDPVQIFDNCNLQFNFICKLT